MQQSFMRNKTEENNVFYNLEGKPPITLKGLRQALPCLFFLGIMYCVVLPHYPFVFFVFLVIMLLVRFFMAIMLKK